MSLGSKVNPIVKQDPVARRLIAGAVAVSELRAEVNRVCAFGSLFRGWGIELRRLKGLGSRAWDLGFWVWGFRFRGLQDRGCTQVRL